MSSRSGNSLLILVLFYWFLAFPLFIRNIDSAIYSAGRYALLLMALCYSASQGAAFAGWKSVRSKLTKHPWTLGFVSLYCIYLAFLLIATVIAAASTTEPTAFLRALANKLQVVLFSIWLFFALSDKDIARVLRLYVDFILVAAVLGVLTVLIVYFDLLDSLFTVTLDSGSERQFYGAGFVWRSAWIGSLYNLSRLQSYSDEPGTFAFALAPAILLSIWSQRYVAAIFLMACLAATFSVGGIVATLIALLYLSARPSHYRSPVLWATGTGIAIIAIVVTIIGVTQKTSLPDPSQFFSTYLSTKYSAAGDNDTSLGARVENVRVVLALVNQYPWGVGLNLSEAFNESLAVGWLVPLVQAGIGGWLFYVLAFGLLLWKGLYGASTSGGLTAILGGVILILGLAALQRGEMDGTAWHCWWIVAFVRVYLVEKQKLLPYRT